MKITESLTVSWVSRKVAAKQRQSARATGFHQCFRLWNEQLRIVIHWRLLQSNFSIGSFNLVYTKP